MTKVLQGIRVLDLSYFLAGPFCCMLLAAMGAEVIRVERPGGDADRKVGLLTPNGESSVILNLARSKKSLTMNLQSDGGRLLFRELVKRSDVIVAGFTPSAKRTMRLDYLSLKDINPGIISVSISGFGQYGPYSERRCFDPVAQAMSGAMSMCGFPDGPPIRSQVPYVDFSTGLYAALATTLCLLYRQKTGQGQEVDIALIDAALSFTMPYFTEYKITGEVYERTGNHSRYNASDMFRTADGWVYIAIMTEPIWKRFLKAIGREDLDGDPRFGDDLTRYCNRDELGPIIQCWTAERTTAEIVEVMERFGIPCGQVLDLTELEGDPHIRARNMVMEIDYPELGKVPLAGLALKLSQTPGDLSAPAAKLGQHNEEIYCELLGLSGKQLARLRAEGVV